MRFLLDNEYYELTVKDEIDLLTESLSGTGESRGDEELRSVMPGGIRHVLVGEGDTVEKNQPLFILEAMKMENEVRAPRAGSVKRIEVEVETTVGAGELLAILSVE